MARHIAHYTLVRLLPQSDAGEFANMGVVVACPALGFFDFRLITRYGRITQFFEEFNRELFTQVRREVEAELAHLRDHLHQRQFASGCREEALALRLVQDLVQPRKPLTRRERANSVKKRDVFGRYGDQARAVLEALLDKFADHGVQNIEDAKVLELHPFDQFGSKTQIRRGIFGGVEQFTQAIQALEQALYEENEKKQA